MQRQPGRPQCVLRSVIVPARTFPLRAIAASSAAISRASSRCLAFNTPPTLAPGVHFPSPSVLYKYGTMTGDDPVVSAICRFSSRNVPEEAEAFAKAVVLAASPPSKARAKSLLFATSRLAEFGISRGLEPLEEVLLAPSVIERFCAVGLRGVSQATRRTVRSNLRYVAARVLADRAFPAPLPRERAKKPYSASEIASYLALCDAQPTEARRMHGLGLICLGAGAGLMGADLRTVRGKDVVCRSGGVLVEVREGRSRAVPLMNRFHEPLLLAASFAGEGFVIGGELVSRKNLTTPLLRSLAGSWHLPPLDTGRLRATWLASCAEQLGLRAFMDAAGISCSQRLGDIVARLEPVAEPRAVCLLGARR